MWQHLCYFFPKIVVPHRIGVVENHILKLYMKIQPFHSRFLAVLLNEVFIRGSPEPNRIHKTSTVGSTVFFSWNRTHLNDKNCASRTLHLTGTQNDLFISSTSDLCLARKTVYQGNTCTQLLWNIHLKACWNVTFKNKYKYGFIVNLLYLFNTGFLTFCYCFIKATVQ